MRILIKFLLTIVLGGMSLILVACGGGGGGGGTTTTSGVKLSGVVATGKPIAGATIVLKDAHGTMETVTADGSGNYTADVSSLTSPILLQVSSANSPTLYSVAASTATGTNVVNVDPFTDLIVRNWYQSQTTPQDIDTVFTTSGAPSNPPTPQDIGTIKKVVTNIIAPVLQQEGVDPTTFDPITSPFVANSTGVDKVLDSTQVSINTSTQTVGVTTTDPTTGISGTAVTSTTPIKDLTVTDSTAPTAPTTVALAATPTDAKVVLTWNSWTDNVGVAGYNVYRGGTKVGTSPYPVYTDSGLSASTQYCYQIEAFDAAGNVSAKSPQQQQCVTTLQSVDTTPPTAPTVTATPGSASAINVSWSGATDNSGYVARYTISRSLGATSTTNPAALIGGTAGTSYADTTGLVPNTQYCYTVTAYDGSGNHSDSSSVCATTSADTTPPTQPTGVTVTAISSSAILVYWTASTDNTAVDHYVLSRTDAGVTVTPSNPIVTGTMSADSGLSQGVQYCYTVTAYDAAGNASTASASKCATIADSTAPTTPTNVTATATSTSAITVSWTASTDNVGVTGYDVYRGTTKVGSSVTGISFGDSGLSAGTKYCYTVQARDAAGNVSAASSSMCATTQAATVVTYWTSSISGTIFSADSSTVTSSATTYFYLNLNQSGSALAGTLGYSDTTGRSGYHVFSGTMSGSTVTISGADFDTACNGRTVTMTGSVSGSTLSLTVSAPAAGTCSAMSQPMSFAQVTATAYNASGTSTYSATNATLTINTTTTNFPSGQGPSSGTSTFTNVTVSATSMSWTDSSGYTMTWTRASGTAGNITGTWSSVEQDGSGVLTLTINSDGTWSVVEQYFGGSASSGGGDTTPPTVPSNVTATAVSSTSISVSWTASTDNVGVAGYDVYDGTNKVGTTTGTTLSENSLAASTKYCYTVDAFDAAGNNSGSSTSACATTLAAGSGGTSSGVQTWTSSMSGTMFSGESLPNETTYYATTFTAAGGVISGALDYVDSLGRTSSEPVSGTISGSNVTTSMTDFDPACSGRTVTGSGTIDATGTILTLALSAPAAGNCTALSGVTLTYNLATPAAIYQASGTYTYSAGTLTLNIASSTFASNGPPIGTMTFSGVTVGATTMPWPGGQINWVRSSGTAGTITGTWWAMMAGGDTYELTMDASGNVSLTGMFMSQAGSPYVQSGVYGNAGGGVAGYTVNIVYPDSTQSASSVSVTGPGITGSLSLTYDSSNKQWDSYQNSVMFTTRPQPPLSYSVTVTDSAGGQTTSTATVGCVMNSLPTAGSAPSSTGSQNFTWTMLSLPYQNIIYDIELSDTSGTRLWNSYDNNGSVLDQSSLAYTGSALTAGTNYLYNLTANIDTADGGGFQCQSMVQNISFTY